MSSDTYCSRQWLINPENPDVHTNASCFFFWGYRPNGVPYNTIVLSDCDEKLVIASEIKHDWTRKNFLRIVQCMIDVISKKKLQSTVRRGYHRFRVKRIKIMDDPYFEHLTFESFHRFRSKNIIHEKQKQTILLHCDLETCSREDYQIKQDILLQELLKFQTFLVHWKKPSSS